MLERSRMSALFTSGLVACALCGCGEAKPKVQPKLPEPVAVKPQAPAAENTAAQDGSDAPAWRVSVAGDDPGLAEVAGMAFPKPTTWIWQPVTNSFRTLQYEVPAVVSGDNSATLVFSQFIGTDGGPTDLNIDRWVGQFSSEDGSPVEPVLDSMVGDGFNVELVETEGAYRGMGAPAPTAGQRQLGAIVEAPGRRIFIRLVGPDSTVDAARVEFQNMLAAAYLTDQSEQDGN